MRHVEIEREADSQLARNVWTFSYDDRTHTFRVVSYAEEVRPTKRHKFRVLNYYSTYSHRQGMNMIHKRDVPVPSSVIDEAKHKFIDTLDVAVGFR